MSKHTPGPWRVDTHCNVMHKDAMVAFPCISGGLNQEANARLIAAAPDLLEALEDIAAYYPNSWAEDVARAAIAKATGEQA